jgi:hypothetical protein
MKRVIGLLALLLSGCVSHIKAPAPVTAPMAPTVGFGGSDAGFGGTAQPSDKLGARLALSYPTCVPGNGVQCTTPYGLWLPPHGYPNWDGPINYNTQAINNALLAAGGHPAAPSFYLQGANNGATAFTTDSSTTPFLSQQITTSVNTTLNVAAPPFNAVSDARSDSTCTVTSGSTALTCTDAPFTSSSCGSGKVISVQFAGGTGGTNQPLVTTCTYVSSTQVTLATPATQTAGGVISGVSLTNIGTSGYVTAHNLPTTTSGSGVGATISISASAGRINGTALPLLGNRGTTGYVTASGLPTTSICGGVAGPNTATVSIVASGGVITSGTISGVGSTYPLGCQIYPTQSGSDGTAYFTVSLIAARMIEGGVGYAVNDKVYPTQAGSSGDAYVTVTAVSPTGAIWGTDDTTAFDAWATALGPGAPGLIPNGQFIYNTAHNANIMSLASNTSITMNRSGTVYLIGIRPGSGPGGTLFWIPQGTTNVQFDGLHVSGEYINNGNGFLGLGYGNVVQFASANGTPTSNVQIQNGIFQNLLGVVTSDLANQDSAISFTNNIVTNTGITGTNLNSSNTTIAYNVFTNTSGIESSGAQSHYNYNKFINPNGQAVVQLGGNTTGAPYFGSEAIGNVVINPSPGDSCISLGDGFSNGLVADNLCTGLSESALGNAFGIINVYSGYVHADNNKIVNNTISGYGSNAAIYLQSVNGDELHGNSSSGTQTGLVTSAATNLNTSGNHWNGAYGNDMTLGGGSTVRTQGDGLVHGSYTLSGGGPLSTLTTDSDINTPTGSYQNGSLQFINPEALTNITSYNTTSGSPNTTPFASGGGGYSVIRLKGDPGLPNPSILDFGPVNAGINQADSQIAAEYDGVYASNLAFCSAFNGNSAFTRDQCVISLRLYANFAGTPNTYGLAVIPGSLAVGTSVSDPGSGNIEYQGQLVGPVTAPSGTCPEVGWVLSGDSKVSVCPSIGGTWTQPFAAPSLTGTTGTITGTSLSASCDSGTASVSGAVVGSPVAVSSTTGADVGGAFNVRGSVTSTGTVSVYVCGTGTPASLAYNVVVF